MSEAPSPQYGPYDQRSGKTTREREAEAEQKALDRFQQPQAKEIAANAKRLDAVEKAINTMKGENGIDVSGSVQAGIIIKDNTPKQNQGGAGGALSEEHEFLVELNGAPVYYWVTSRYSRDA